MLGLSDRAEATNSCRGCVINGVYLADKSRVSRWLNDASTDSRRTLSP
jgi:hypothetical protein